MKGAVFGRPFFFPKPVSRRFWKATKEQEMAKMKCPDNCGGCSVGGNEYVADKKGLITVPEEFVAALEGHGYTLATDDKAKPAAPAEPAAE